MWREIGKKTAAARDTERGVPGGSYHRRPQTGAAPRPRYSKAPSLGRKQEIPPPVGIWTGSPTWSAPLPISDPPIHTAVRTWFTSNVRVPARLHHRRCARLRFVRHMGLSVSYFSTEPRVAGQSLPPDLCTPYPFHGGLPSHCPSTLERPDPPQTPAHNAASTHVPVASMAGQTPSPPSKGMAASCVISVWLPRLHRVYSVSLSLDASNQNSNQKLHRQAVSKGNGRGPMNGKYGQRL